MIGNGSKFMGLRFSGFELDVTASELRDPSGSPVKLQQQPLKLLTLLAQRAGALVTREEIQQHLWGADTFVDFEQGVNYCIKQIRIALQDDAQAPRYIETLPRRGYRFIAAVEEWETAPMALPTSATDARAVAEPPAESFRQAPEQSIKPLPHSPLLRTGVRRYRLLMALLFIALLATAWVVWRALRPPVAPVKKVMLAVLPFENLSGDAAEEYFSDGMTEEMITQLGRLQPQQLGIIARTSVMAYKNTTKDVASIGRELQVDYLLEGSVRRADDILRVTAQLIQVSDQTHLWAETYDRTDLNILTVQSEIAAHIARTLAVELLPAATPDAEQAIARNPSAYDDYLKGRYLAGKGTRDSLFKSVDYFAQALAKAPLDAATHAAQADAYYQLGFASLLAPQEAYRKAKAAAAHAIELDNRHAEAYATLGSVQFRLDWQWAEAERSFLKALEINPNSALAHHDYSWYLIACKRFDEAVAEIKRAQALDPLSLRINADAGWIHLRARRYDEAIAQIRRLLEIEPNSSVGLECLECAYVQKGMYAESLVEARKIMTRFGATAEEIALVTGGDAATAVKRVEQWRLKRLQAAAQKVSLNPYSFALQYAAAEDRGAALDWLRRAYDERDPAIITLQVDQVWDSLRYDPRYQEIVTRLSFPP